MKLNKVHQEFRNPRVFYPDPKNLDLDRVLINLFLLLKCGGTRPATRGRQKEDAQRVETHLDALIKMPGVKGFEEHRWVAQSWLETDIFDLVNRGRSTEAIASLRPLHLEAHKVRVSKHSRDYNHADALYAMLEHGERQALEDLRRYLEAGRDPATRKYDGETQLDLETLTVLKLVADIPDMHPGKDKVTPHPPVCRGQSRLLCDDVQRLLAYREVVPRPVMIDYLKTILGLHSALFVLRVRRQLSGWIRDRSSHPKCRDCPVHGGLDFPFKECPYDFRLIADLGDDFRTRMAQLAQESAASEYAQLVDLVRAVFSMNQLLRYAREARGEGIPEDPFEVPAMLNPETQPADFLAVFKVRLDDIVRDNQDRDQESLTPELEAILEAGMDHFETFIEVVTHVRQKHHVSYLVQMLDKLLQKNTAFGALAQGRSGSNPRRWHLGGRLLEVFVQLAVLRVEQSGDQRTFSTEPMLIDDFMRWIERRYGFVVGLPETEHSAPVTIDEHKAYQANVLGLKDRLREIGFYDDLSDAYNAQTIRPRYHLERVAP